jgi:ribosome maturation factor RimP
MISKERILEVATKVCEELEKEGKGTLSVAKITNNNANNIVVYLSKATGINIDDCANVSKEIEKMLDRDVEDFSLTVSSLGVK